MLLPQEPHFDERLHVGVHVLVVPPERVREGPNPQPFVRGHIANQLQPFFRDCAEKTTAVFSRRQYSHRMTTLEAALERIVAVAKPDRVILFGSAARGTAGPHSDLDFLVIKRGVTSRRRLAQSIYRALIGIRASVDVVVVTPEDVESLKDGFGTIVGPAMREGREVYAA